MSGFTYVIGVDMEGESGLNKLLGLFDRLDKTVSKIEGQVDRLGGAVEDMGQRGGRTMQTLTTGLGGWLTTLAGMIGIADSINQAVNMEGMENRFQRLTGNGAGNLALVREQADKLGVSTGVAMQGFDRLANVMGNLPGGQLETTFTGFLTGAKALGRTEAEASNLFEGLFELSRKGVVEMKDFEQALGQHLPGAFGIAARSMGLTENQLARMINQGSIMADDLLPKMGTQLQTELGGKAAEAANTAGSTMNRLQNSVLDLRTAIGDELLTVLQPLVNDYLLPALGWLREHISIVGLLAAAIGGWYAQGLLVSGMIKAWTGLQAAWNAVTTIAGVATKLFTGGITGLNAAMLANPIGILIGLLGALVAGVMYAWNRFEGFRGFIVGMWEVIKVFGNILKEFLIDPFVALGEVLLGVFTGNADLIEAGMDRSLNAARRLSNIGELGRELGQAYKSGFQKGVESDYKFDLFNFQKDPISEAFGAGQGKTNASGSIGGKAKKGVSEIIGGGAKNITINVGKMIESQNVYTSGEMTDIRRRIKEEATKALFEVLNSANQVQVN